MSAATRSAWSVCRFGVAMAMTALMVLSSSALAAAHSELLGSDPADGATIQTSPARVTLTFDQDIQPGFSVVTLVGPDGVQHQTGAVTEDGAAAALEVRPLTAAGEYTVGYRVLSADSHPIEGTVRFEFTGAPAATSTSPSLSAAPTPPTAAHEAAASPDDGPSVWPWVLAVVLLLAGGVVAALRLGRAS